MPVRRLPETYPLPSIGIEGAKRMQFRLMEYVCAHFEGDELLRSDLGVTPKWGRPSTTRKVEEALTDFFGAGGCALVQGAGTGAIRAMLDATLPAVSGSWSTMPHPTRQAAKLLRARGWSSCARTSTTRTSCGQLRRTVGSRRSHSSSTRAKDPRTGMTWRRWRELLALGE